MLWDRSSSNSACSAARPDEDIHPDHPSGSSVRRLSNAAPDTVLFVGLLVATVLIVGALTFLPGDALGPVVEHLRLLGGKTG
jgi:hypothetical protein